MALGSSAPEILLSVIEVYKVFYKLERKCMVFSKLFYLRITNYVFINERKMSA